MRFSVPLTLIASAAFVTAPSIASASPMNATDFKIVVAHDDLNLANEADAKRLEQRVQTRIRQLCANGGRDSASMRLERECREGAYADAKREVRLAIAEARANTPRLATTSQASDTDTSGG